MASFVMFLTSAIFLGVTFQLFVEFNRAQDLPYMDEIFHVPQAQNYCHGNFEHWNDKITTLPGLYVFSQVFLKSWSLLKGNLLEEVCAAIHLRSTNCIFMMSLFLMTHKILKHAQNETQNGADDGKLWVTALVISTFPVLYFFTFLYYTDVGSTLFVLCLYYSSIKKKHWLAMLCGAIAILFRQTNIVWVGFSCAAAILDYLKESKTLSINDAWYYQVYKAVVGCLMNILTVLKIAFPYCLVLLGFVVFVIKNNGIVVGDRSSHEACLHFPQLLYFTLFTMVFSSFIVLRYLNFMKILSMIRKNLMSPMRIICGIATFSGMVAAVRYFTHVHLYLISDNRHYPFYVWKKIFENHPLARYALVPVYFVSLLIMVNELACKHNTLWIILYFACTAVVVVPQKLLEFRYFIIPYLLFRLNIKQSSWIELAVEEAVYLVINWFTMNIFLTRTHTQDGMDGQRIMW